MKGERQEKGNEEEDKTMTRVSRTYYTVILRYMIQNDL